MNSYAPIFARIKVFPDEDKNVTPSGLILSVDPMKAKRIVTGKVVAVGENCSSVRVGDNILYGEYAGFPVYEDSDGNIVHYDDVLKLKQAIKYQYMNEDDVVSVKRKGK